MKKTMDGNEAAAYVSYAFTEVATIYPITPSSPMAEHVDVWAANGKKNMFGQTVRLVEMQSEAGACGAMHGSLEAGALTTSYTASQGLMLMIPPMYRISGQLMPGVLHVAARTVGTHAFSIFGDHSDVMATRQTGFAMLSSGSVQETMDLAGVAHLSAIKGHVPFLHFFDGFRTSHELQKIDVIDYDDLAKLVDQKELTKFRKNALNPEHPVQRSTVQNPDVFFQAREANNPYYEALPMIVEEYMQEINKITGRDYHLFNYYGDEDATDVVIAMGSVSGVAMEVVDYLRKQGKKVGYLQVHLYRPFDVNFFLSKMPGTVKRVAVLDRTKECGALGEPLYLDVCAAFANKADAPKIIGGRYGLSSKDVTPAQLLAVYENLAKYEPKNHFTVGIEDDVTFHSLTMPEEVNLCDPSTVSCKFWGLGSDGTVGANKNSIKIIGDNTDQYVQAYFEYDTKKSGGITKSHLRFGHSPIRGSYLVKQADFVACHNQSYIQKYDIVSEIKEGGVFLLNTLWKDEELNEKLPAKVRRTIAKKHIKFYCIDAVDIAKEIGLGNRTNAILQAAFFKLANIIPIDDAVKYMKEAIVKSYGHKGEKVVEMNNKAVDAGVDALREVKVPAEWADAKDCCCEEKKVCTCGASEELATYIKEVQIPVNALKGDDLPVSAFKNHPDGTVPLGTSKFEKRGVSVDVPVWDQTKCIQCNQCSLVCPHACVRPFLLTEEEAKNAPEGYKCLDATGKGMENYKFAITISPLDCTGCGSCIKSCPVDALSFTSLESQDAEVKNWDYAVKLPHKENPMDKFTVKGSQFEQPLLEFSGACAGCGETTYAKLMTQLFGDRMYFANATGCTQAWGAACPSVPYTTNQDGRGPAWSNSLFENNAEFSLGMVLAVKQQRERLAMQIQHLKEEIGSSDAALTKAIDEYLEKKDCMDCTMKVSDELVKALEASDVKSEYKDFVLQNKEHLSKKSMWMYGGDGWAYDIGYGGLDHVLASGEDVNILIVDTEVYSNTGGQSSKATPVGAVAQFAASGKKTAKKDLGMLAMAYGYVYVAQVALGANPAQLIKAMKEAEAYHGPSIIIAYAPCINHGIVKGMSTAMEESKKAVEAGYWFLYRYNPLLKEEGKNPFILDSKEPKNDYREFLMGEVRYASLLRTFPESGEKLLQQAEAGAKEKYQSYKEMAEE
ncbi:pyruvate-ferredoxin/flavodoxin oxidoreductase [Lachnospiraceae bacterium XBB1006]|nr:pyruvate-ferredoxin/flavodoxin oxidoreductase [Lachnospiraceae bacterium XBB1006]